MCILLYILPLGLPIKKSSHHILISPGLLLRDGCCDLFLCWNFSDIASCFSCTAAGISFSTAYEAPKHFVSSRKRFFDDKDCAMYKAETLSENHRLSFSPVAINFSNMFYYIESSGGLRVRCHSRNYIFVIFAFVAGIHDLTLFRRVFMCEASECSGSPAQHERWSCVYKCMSILERRLIPIDVVILFITSWLDLDFSLSLCNKLSHPIGSSNVFLLIRSYRQRFSGNDAFLFFSAFRPIDAVYSIRPASLLKQDIRCVSTSTLMSPNVEQSNTSFVGQRGF